MVEIAEELVEAVDGRQHFVAVAEVVLAELAGRIAERLEQLGDSRVSLGMPSFAPGRPTLVRPVRIGDCPVMNAARPGRAALLAVPVGENRAFIGDAVDVRRLVAHHALL